MKKSIQNLLIFAILISMIAGCKKTGDDTIVYHSINKEYVLIRNVEALLESDDDISNHIDSIMSGLIETEFISTGHKSFDLDGDRLFDIAFEIINLHPFNPNGLPESFDSLAARVIPLRVQILDNSTYGYPTALNINEEINENGNWTNNTGVLGTFMNAGQFQGKREKYLAFRFPDENGFKYGWINVYCSEHNDTLRIIDYAYSDLPNQKINAGQKE